MSLTDHHPEGNSASPLKCPMRSQSDLQLRNGNPNYHGNNSNTNNSGNSSATKTAHPKKTPRRGVHTRSQSHTRTPVRLSTSATGTKPHLNRSKSSDGIVRPGRPGVSRNSRSFTKLSGLQPLTKTLLNGSYPRGTGLAPLTKTTLNGSLKGVQPLTKTALNGSLKQYGLRKSALNGSVKGMKKAALDHLLRSLKASNSTKAIYGSANTGLKTSGKRGRAILNLNEDAGDNEYEDLSDNLYDRDGEHHEGHDGGLPTTREGREDREGLEALQAREVNGNTSGPQAQPEFKEGASISGANSTDDFSSALYGGSLLLSQSTGLTRKIGPISELPYESDSRAPEENGFSFAPAPRLTTTESTLKTAESYQPNQTIFSNLQRTNTQFLNNMMLQRQTPAQEKKAAVSRPELLHSDNGHSAHKDFSAFLKSNQTPLNTIETRTQQRLWLQRENSMMEVPPAVDVSKLQNFSSFSLNKLMFSHNYNNSSTNLREGQNTSSTQQSTDVTPLRETPPPTAPESVTNLFYMIQGGQNSIQSRTEFERLNRGYVNVRRYVNPVAESLNRLRKNLDGEFDVQKRQNKKNGYAQAANTFGEYYPKWEEQREVADATINQMWQSALISNSSSTASLQHYQQEQRNHQSPAVHRGSYTNTPGRSINPTTRAVKLAALAATASQN